MQIIIGSNSADQLTALYAESGATLESLEWHILPRFPDFPPHKLH
jgi:hypothetical protein